MTEARKTEFILSILYNNEDREKIMRNYDGEPAEVFLKKDGILSRGPTPDDTYTPPPENPAKADRLFRDFFAYKEKMFLQSYG